MTFCANNLFQGLDVVTSWPSGSFTEDQSWTCTAMTSGDFAQVLQTIFACKAFTMPLGHDSFGIFITDIPLTFVH